MGKKWCILIFLIVVATYSASARVRGNGFYDISWQADGKDSMMVVHVIPITKYQRKADMRRYYKLIYNIKKVYPVAKFARDKLRETEEILAKTTDKKEQRKILDNLQKELIAEYTPVLKKMTFSQGKILIKLIDRETGRSSFQILKDLKGGFVAGFWQMIAKIFSSDLKDNYDKDGEDKLIEQLIIYYEAGLI